MKILLTGYIEKVSPEVKNLKSEETIYEKDFKSHILKYYRRSYS